MTWTGSTRERKLNDHPHRTHWWRTVDQHWPNLLAIFERVGMKLDVAEDRHGDIMYVPLRDELDAPHGPR